MYISVNKYIKSLTRTGGGTNREGTYGKIMDVDAYFTIKVLYVNKSNKSGGFPKKLYTRNLSPKEVQDSFQQSVLKIPKNEIDNAEIYGSILVSHNTALDSWNNTQFVLLTATRPDDSTKEFDVCDINDDKAQSYVAKIVPNGQKEKLCVYAPIALYSCDGKSIYPLYYKCSPVEKCAIIPPENKQTLVSFIKMLHGLGHCYNDIKRQNLVNKNDNVVFCDYGSIKPFSRFTTIFSCTMTEMGSTFPSPTVVYNSDSNSIKYLQNITQSHSQTPNMQCLFASYYSKYYSSISRDDWNIIYNTWTVNHPDRFCVPNILKANDFFGLGLLFKIREWIDKPCPNGEGEYLNLNTQGGSFETIHILGRKRKLIKKGRGHILRYKGVFITLSLAKNLEKSLIKR